MDPAVFTTMDPGVPRPIQILSHRWVRAQLRSVPLRDGDHRALPPARELGGGSTPSSSKTSQSVCAGVSLFSNRADQSKRSGRTPGRATTGEVIMASRVVRSFVVVGFAVALSADLALANRPVGAGGCPHPRPDCVCIMIYDPVVCDGGCTYSNPCVASCAGARNCGAQSAPPGLARSLVVIAESGVPHRELLEARIASLYSAEAAGDWRQWYDHISPISREELSFDQFEMESRTRDFTIVSWKITSIKRRTPPPAEVQAAANIAMEVWVRRGSSPPEQEKEQTDYWVLIDGQWYWHWRGWPAD